MEKEERDSRAEAKPSLEARAWHGSAIMCGSGSASYVLLGHSPAIRGAWVVGVHSSKNGARTSSIASSERRGQHGVPQGLYFAWLRTAKLRFTVTPLVDLGLDILGTAGSPSLRAKGHETLTLLRWLREFLPIWSINSVKVPPGCWPPTLCVTCGNSWPKGPWSCRRPPSRITQGANVRTPMAP